MNQFCKIKTDIPEAAAVIKQAPYPGKESVYGSYGILSLCKGTHAVPDTFLGYGSYISIPAETEHKVIKVILISQNGIFGKTFYPFKKNHVFLNALFKSTLFTTAFHLFLRNFS
jgi:hypothetical protein